MKLSFFYFICHVCCVSWWKLQLFMEKFDVCVQYNRIFAYCVPFKKILINVYQKGGVHPHRWAFRLLLINYRPFGIIYRKLHKGIFNIINFWPFIESSLLYNFILSLYLIDANTCSCSFLESFLRYNDNDTFMSVSASWHGWVVLVMVGFVSSTRESPYMPSAGTRPPSPSPVSTSRWRDGSQVRTVGCIILCIKSAFAHGLKQWCNIAFHFFFICIVFQLYSLCLIFISILFCNIYIDVSWLTPV